MNVFIVEDDSTQIKGIASIIKDNFQNTHCIKATSFEKAKNILDEQLKDIDVILLDIDLNSDEGLDGIDLGRYIRNMPQYKNTPILFLTGLPEEAARAVHTTNCFDFLTKPFADSELISSLQKLVDMKLVEENPIRFRDVSGIYYRPLPSQIKYIKAHHRSIIVSTTFGDFVSNSSTLNDCSNILPDTFIRCHRSYIVNTSYVYAYDRSNSYITVADTDGIQIPVSRRYLHSVSDTLATFK